LPLVAIDLLTGRAPRELVAIGDCVHEAMVAELSVPERDRFQSLNEHEPGAFSFDPGYLDIERSDRFVLVRVTLAAGRTTEQKRAFYQRLAELLAERIDLRPEDLAICLTENAREDWSLGLGQANYLELPPERWR
jgi:4-oxalocrotonate tautomerase